MSTEKYQRYTLFNIQHRIKILGHFNTIQEIEKYHVKNPPNYPYGEKRLVWDNYEKRFLEHTWEETLK